MEDWRDHEDRDGRREARLEEGECVNRHGDKRAERRQPRAHPRTAHREAVAQEAAEEGADRHGDARDKAERVGRERDLFADGGPKMYVRTKYDTRNCALP